MLLQNKTIAIVGGGPGGLTLARLLQLKGVDVKVYERDADQYARMVGSPLDLHETSGLAALRMAELLDEFKKNYRPGADRELIVNEQAEIFFDDHHIKPEENFGSEHFRPEIDRGPLRNMLLESLTPGTVIWNSHFISMERQGDGWMLHFKNAEPVYADLVIGSDGANSKVRPHLTSIKAFYSGILMIEGNVINAAKATPHIFEMLRGGKLMAFGDRKNLLMGSKENGDITYYISFKADEQWVRENGLDYSNSAQMLEWFRNTYTAWSPLWHELLNNAATPFIPRPIYCMPLDQSWEAVGNATIIGDAAHVMPPFAGEGVNMAMLDALELAECLTSGKHISLVNAISSYETGMCARASQAAKESLENGERMHAPDALETMVGFFNGMHATQDPA